MFFHLLNLIGRSLGAIPRSLGSTLLGVLFPIGVALLGEAIGVFLFGWRAMLQNWKKTTRVGLAAGQSHLDFELPTRTDLNGHGFSRAEIWCEKGTGFSRWGMLLG